VIAKVFLVDTKWRPRMRRSGPRLTPDFAGSGLLVALSQRGHLGCLKQAGNQKGRDLKPPAFGLHISSLVQAATNGTVFSARSFE
jgi:hypothetical protein